MSVASIPIPAERIPPVAEDMAQSSKTVGAVLLFVCGVILIAMISVMFEDKELEDEYRPRNSAEAAGHKVGVVFAFALFGGLPALYGFRAIRNASRATRAATLAKTEPTYSWQLSGGYVVVADGAGVPRPELSFKLNRKLRGMLLAVPEARAIPPS